MKYFDVCYYESEEDMKYPPGEDPLFGNYFPDGIYSNMGRNRRFELFCILKMKYAKVEALSLVEAWAKFMLEHTTVIVVRIEDERTPYQSPIAHA